MLNAKRQTTIFNGAGLTDAPADFDFFIDGDHAELLLEIYDIAGTTPTLQVEVIELSDDGLSLPYDGQTADFTIGATVTGYNFSGGVHATGLIVNDTDAGATGTLILRNVTGKFVDDMILRDDNGTQGVAVVNSATGGTVIKGEQGTWADSTAVAVNTQMTLLNPDAGLSAGDERTRVYPRNFRLAFTEGGSWTNADFAIDLVQS